MTNNPIPSLPEGPADGVTQTGWPVPDGWALVPIEPTEEMKDAGWQLERTRFSQPVPKDYWSAMIAAAPLPPPPQDKTHG